jgi:hypothetical protein
VDSVGEVFAGIIEFIVRILYGVVRLIIWIIGFFLSQTWLVNHFNGLRRFGLWLAAASAFYLLFGILRATVEPLWTPALTPIFQWQIVVAAMVLLLVGIALRELDAANYGITTTRGPVPEKPTKPADTSPIQTLATPHSHSVIARLVGVALLIGIASAFSSERHEATLSEKLCAQADARISEGVEQRVRDGAGWLDRVLGTQTADRIPCGDD